MELATLVEKLKQSPPKRIAVAAAQDDVVLKSVAEAYKLGIVLPVLCGDIEQIDAAARRHNIDISPFEIIETDSDLQSAAIAVALVREKKADMLMKGLLQTSTLLRAVLHKENGLRSGSGILSHVGVVNSPILGRTLFMTDAAMVMYPDLKTKAELIKNAVTVAKCLGIPVPKVAVLAAVEVVNPDMQATLDAAALTLMNHRGQLADCIVDGPLAFDLAASPEAVAHKKVQSEVAGCADILLFHNIEAGNSTMKAMTVAGNATLGGLIMGASAPIVLTSRSDSDTSKLYSIACAAAVAMA